MPHKHIPLRFVNLKQKFFVNGLFERNNLLTANMNLTLYVKGQKHILPLIKLIDGK